jgi:hypothetical protein
MVQKISKLKTEQTPEQEQIVWAEVLSHRNKLLLNSDWTQMQDSGLTEDCINQWRTWRRQLKNINRLNLSDPKIAEIQITKLSRRPPYNSYVSVNVEPDAAAVVSTVELRERTLTYLNNAFNTKAFPSFLDNPYLVDEQFKEVVDFNKNPTLSYPLISATAELYGMSVDTVAAEFVSRKVEQMKRLVNLKQKYFYFQSLVNNAHSDVELAEAQAEIKKWIST